MLQRKFNWFQAFGYIEQIERIDWHNICQIFNEQNHEQTNKWCRQARYQKTKYVSGLLIAQLPCYLLFHITFNKSQQLCFGYFPPNYSTLINFAKSNMVRGDNLIINNSPFLLSKNVFFFAWVQKLFIPFHMTQFLNVFKHVKLCCISLE